MSKEKAEGERLLLALPPDVLEGAVYRVCFACMKNAPEVKVAVQETSFRLINPVGAIPEGIAPVTAGKQTKREGL